MTIKLYLQKNQAARVKEKWFTAYRDGRLNDCELIEVVAEVLQPVQRR